MFKLKKIILKHIFCTVMICDTLKTHILKKAAGKFGGQNAMHACNWKHTLIFLFHHTSFEAEKHEKDVTCFLSRVLHIIRLKTSGRSTRGPGSGSNADLSRPLCLYTDKLKR